MEHRIEGRIDQRKRARDWKPGVVVGGLLAIAGMLITAAAVYQLQVTGDERRAEAQRVRPLTKPAPPTPEQLQARQELARLRLERDKARAAAWRERLDAEPGNDEVRCYSGTRLVKRDGAWTDAGQC